MKALVRAIAGLDDALAWLTELPKLPPTSTPQRGTGVWHDKQAHE